MGGAVQRTFIARSAGLSERELTIESLAARWAEVMDEGGAETVGIGSFDTSGWKIRAYQGNG